MARFAMVLCVTFLSSPAWAEAPELPERAREGLLRAARYFAGEVATEGGYLWLYSPDLSQREGEGAASLTQVWVQPPGTPTVGQALLAAYQATKETALRDAALAAAHCLVRGQLRSGGWDYSIEFDPAKRERYAYRVDPPRSKARDTTTLDDDTTQATLRFLMAVDGEWQGQDSQVREAVTYALEHLLRVQYPIGAWPQRFEQPPVAADFPVRDASYPESWSRTFPDRDYRHDYTLNDNSLADMITTMLAAYRQYGDERFRQAALRGGDFLVRAQMPDPQPAWAQQYDTAMHPSWARKFEPPSVTGGESQGAIRILLDLHLATGENRFLEPIPRALDYLERSRLENGQMARFYELRTNQPLYFTMDYVLTERDDDVPTHYAFKTSDKTASLRKRFEQQRGLSDEQREAQIARANRPPGLSAELAARVEAILAALDDQGRWVETGTLKTLAASEQAGQVLACDTFARNVQTLAAYLAAVAADRE